MRRRLWMTPVALVSVLVVGLVAFSSASDAELPAAADVGVPEGAASPLDNSMISPQGELGVGVAPLYPGEQSRARAMVLGDPRVVEHTQNARHAVLLVQRRQEAKGNLQARRAEVYIYVYPSSRMLYGVANLRSDAVDRVQVVQGWQPPITQEESLQALNIALADPQSSALIKGQYQQLNGAQFRSADQLRVTAGAFNYSYTRVDIPTAKVCGVQRCAQLLISVPAGYALDAMPIVNLSSERVVYAGQ